MTIDIEQERKARIAELEAENAQLKHDNHNLNWALGTDGYTSMATPEEQAESDAAFERTMAFIGRMKERKNAFEALESANAAQAARITELEAKLAAIEAQEPVGGIVEVRAENTDWQRYAIYDKYDQARRTAHIIDGKPLVEARVIPLYTTPPLRELTDEDIKIAATYVPCEAFTDEMAIEFARAIERHLKGGE